ncbi:MAG: AAA family ATPase [Candidatus Nitrosocaldaceae archaeon]
MKISNIHKVLDIASKSNKTVLLLGQVGIGKTFSVYSWAEEWAERQGKKLVKYGDKIDGDSLIFVEIVPSRIESVDLNGVLRIVDGEAKYVPLHWAVELQRRGGIIFVDEFTTAPDDVQASLMKLVQERRAGDIVFEKNVVIICAGNDASQSRLARRLGEPLRAGKMLIVNVEASTVEEWIHYMIRKGKINNDIFAFLFANKQYFVYDEEMLLVRPRSWENIVDVFGSEIIIGDEVTLALAQGYLGREITAKLQQFIKYKSQMLKLDELQEWNVNARIKFEEADNNVKMLSALQLISEDLERYSKFIEYLAEKYEELLMLIMSSKTYDEFVSLLTIEKISNKIIEMVEKIQRLRS